MTFDSSSVSIIHPHALVRDILNVDAIDKFCKELVDKHIRPHHRGLKDDLAIAWVMSTLRNWMVQSGAIRMIVTPREYLLDPSRNNVVIVDPATLPEFAVKKMSMGYPIYWWLKDSTKVTINALVNGKTVSVDVPFADIIHYVRFKTKASPNIRDSVQVVGRVVEERKRKGIRMRMVKDTKSDYASVDSKALSDAGLYAVLLASDHAYEREGFLMRQCLVKEYRTGGVAWSIRRQGYKRPIGTLYATIWNIPDVGSTYTYSQFTGFANGKAPIEEHVLQAFCQELKLHEIPEVINVSRTAAEIGKWKDWGSPVDDFREDKDGVIEDGFGRQAQPAKDGWYSERFNQYICDGIVVNPMVENFLVDEVFSLDKWDLDDLWLWPGRGPEHNAATRDLIMRTRVLKPRKYQEDNPNIPMFQPHFFRLPMEVARNTVDSCIEQLLEKKECVHEIVSALVAKMDKDEEEPRPRGPVA